MYDRVRKQLFLKSGISLNDFKTSLIDNRLIKLAGKLDYDGDPKALVSRVEEGEYAQEFINSFTTNKTGFFRENAQFDDLKNRVLPKLYEDGWTFNIYSCACSTGEEAYSIAIAMSHVKEQINSKTIGRIVATDIDTEVLEAAKQGIFTYRHEEQHFPSWVQLNKYFKRRVDEGHQKECFTIKANDSLQNLISFRQNNLMNEHYGFKPEEFDVLFCRNVLIYFDRERQNQILKKIFRYLKVGGTLYLGHSEHPLELSDHVERLGHNILIKKSHLPPN